MTTKKEKPGNRTILFRMKNGFHIDFHSLTGISDPVDVGDNLQRTAKTAMKVDDGIAAYALVDCKTWARDCFLVNVLAYHLVKRDTPLKKIWYVLAGEGAVKGIKAPSYKATREWVDEKMDEFMLASRLAEALGPAIGMHPPTWTFRETSIGASRHRPDPCKGEVSRRDGQDRNQAQVRAPHAKEDRRRGTP